MYTNIIHNDDICNYFLKNKQFIFNSLGNCRECRIYIRTSKLKPKLKTISFLTEIADLRCHLGLIYVKTSIFCKKNV